MTEFGEGYARGGQGPAGVPTWSDASEFAVVHFSYAPRALFDSVRSSSHSHPPSFVTFCSHRQPWVPISRKHWVCITFLQPCCGRNGCRETVAGRVE